MRNSPSAQALLENLRDAGCGSGLVERFLTLEESNDVKGQLDLLRGHREQLIKRVHREEAKICCLDYLTYQLKKKINHN
ncbi:MAG: hypothetical protein ACLRVT_06450 [Oscillospiraceae bacterium]